MRTVSSFPARFSVVQMLSLVLMLSPMLGMANPSSAKINRVIQTAQSYLGTPHRMGGMNQNGIDCSGLMVVSFASADYALPRSTRDQVRDGKAVKQSELQPGDLVFFQQGRNVSHVGLVVETNAKGVRFIHTSKSKGVMVSSLESGAYWNRYFHSARRIWKGSYQREVAQNNSRKSKKAKATTSAPMSLRPVGDFPQTAERVLRKKELKSMSLHSRTLMEAEILARHGYRFKDRSLRRHFSDMVWYKTLPKEKKKRKVLRVLSPIEKKNYQRLERMNR